jgi:hypothetical protein
MLATAEILAYTSPEFTEPVQNLISKLLYLSVATTN